MNIYLITHFEHVEAFYMSADGILHVQETPIGGHLSLAPEDWAEVDEKDYDDTFLLEVRGKLSN